MFNWKRLLSLGCITTMMLGGLVKTNSYATNYDIDYVQEVGLGVSSNKNIYLYDDRIDTKDGGFITYSYNTATNIDGELYNSSGNMYITKYDSNNNKEWNKAIVYNDRIVIVDGIETSDGGYIFVGSSKATNIPNHVNEGDEDALIFKLDKNGNQEWIKTFGGNKIDMFTKIIELKDGDYLVYGTSYSTSFDKQPLTGYQNTVIMKFDNNGIVKMKKISNGNRQETYCNIFKINDNQFIEGFTSNSSNINGFTTKGGEDLVFVKYDENFNQEFINSWGGNRNDRILDLKQTSDGGYIAFIESESTDIAGITNKGDYDAVIVKFDKNFNQQWVTSFGGEDCDYIEDGIETSDGGFLLNIYTYSEWFEGIYTDWYADIFIKLDKNGNTEWMEQLNDNYVINDMAETKDGFIGVGYTTGREINGVPVKGQGDAVIVKYDKNHNLQFIKLFGGNGEESFYHVSVGKNNKIIINGYSTSTDLDGIPNPHGFLSTYFVFDEQKSIIREAESDELQVTVEANNSLELALSTNQITFENYNGTQDFTNNDLNVTVSSGLNYDLSATMLEEFTPTFDSSATLDKSNLQIKTAGDSNYTPFTTIGDKVMLVTNAPNGKDNVHNINFKLLGDSSVKADTYNTSIKFEAEQK